MNINKSAAVGPKRGTRDIVPTIRGSLGRDHLRAFVSCWWGRVIKVSCSDTAF